MKYTITTADDETLEFDCYSKVEKAIIKKILKVNNDLETEYTKSKALQIVNLL